MLGREQNTTSTSGNLTDIMVNGVSRRIASSCLRVSSSIFRTATNLNAYLITLGRTIPALVAKCKLMAAPLRRIVARELDIFTPRPKYQIYSLIDELECGHTRDVYLHNGLLDLLNAYTDNPAIRAKRHRCQPCAQLLATRKPMQTVTVLRPAKTA